MFITLKCPSGDGDTEMEQVATRGASPGQERSRMRLGRRPACISCQTRKVGHCCAFFFCLAGLSQMLTRRTAAVYWPHRELRPMQGQVHCLCVSLRPVKDSDMDQPVRPSQPGFHGRDGCRAPESLQVPEPAGGGTPGTQLRVASRRSPV